MTSRATPHRALRAPEDFSLVLGGPLYQLLRWSHMADNALELVRRRVVMFALVGWLPLLLLSIAGGSALGAVAVPFLLDVEVHIRFLLVVPLLIIAELVVHRRMRNIVKQFLDRQLVPDAALERFHAAVTSAFRLRNSIAAELLLVALVYGVGVSLVWRHYSALTDATWYAAPVEGTMRLSWAGWWYGYISLPLFQFLLVRWYWRLFVWARFLWQVSRIELSLVPTHPDRLAGLGFLSNTVYAFVPLLVAHGTMLAGMIASRIFHLGAALTGFKIEIGVVVAFVLCIVFGPLLVFAPKLAAAKRQGLGDYGTLAERYIREFDAKWLHGAAPQDEALVGSADIQSLADLDGSFDIVRTMRIVPITRDAIVQLAAATLAPLVPLALTMMPFEELMKRLFGILF